MEGFLNFLGSQAFGNVLLALGASLAAWSVVSSRILTRRKQTAEMLLQLRSDARMSTGYNILRDLHDNGGSSKLAGLADDPALAEKASDARYILNYWENVAVGISQGIYCEKILKNTHCLIFCNMVNHAMPFIKRTRAKAGKNTIWRDIENLKNKWEKKPLV